MSRREAEHSTRSPSIDIVSVFEGADCLEPVFFARGLRRLVVEWDV